MSDHARAPANVMTIPRARSFAETADNIFGTPADLFGNSVTTCSILCGAEAFIGDEEAPERFRLLTWQDIGTIARRLAATVIEQRMKAAEAEFSASILAGGTPSTPGETQILAATKAPACAVSASPQALAVGRKAGRQMTA